MKNQKRLMVWGQNTDDNITITWKDNKVKKFCTWFWIIHFIYKNKINFELASCSCDVVFFGILVLLQDQRAKCVYNCLKLNKITR